MIQPHHDVAIPPASPGSVRNSRLMDEATALLTTLEVTPALAPTACIGWTAHELVAHLTAGAAEMAELVEAVVTGRAERATRAFAEREAPFVAMADDELRGRLLIEAARLIEAVSALDPGRDVAFSGRRVDAAEIALHGRSEAALHRWDLAGDDDVSRELLSQPELTGHALGVLNEMLEGSGEAVSARAAGIGVGRYAFASPHQPDVVLVVDCQGARLELDSPGPSPVCSANSDVRLLALWGRRSTVEVPRWLGSDTDCARLGRFIGMSDFHPVTTEDR